VKRWGEEGESRGALEHQAAVGEEGYLVRVNPKQRSTRGETRSFETRTAAREERKKPGVLNFFRGGARERSALVVGARWCEGGVSCEKTRREEQFKEGI